MGRHIAKSSSLTSSLFLHLQCLQWPSSHSFLALYLVSLSFAKSLSLSASNFQIPFLKVGTILNTNVFISRTKFITLYISVTCAMEAPSILLDNSLTGFVISGLLCLVRHNNVPTPDLYMDCVFSSTFEISSPFHQ